MGDNVSKITYILEAAQATTEAAKVEASFAGIEKAAKSSGLGASAALTQVEAATRGAAVSGANLQAVYEGVVKSQGGNSAAALQLAAALGIEKQTAEEVGETLAAAGENAKKAEEGHNKLHKQVTLGNGILSGYELIIEQLIKSLGGLPLPILIALPILNALAGHLLKLGEAKKEHIELDKEQLAVDLLRNESNIRVVRVGGDLLSALRILSAEQKEYEKNTASLTGRLQVLEKEGLTTYSSVSQGGEVYRRVAKSAEDLQIESANLNSELGKQEKVLGPALEVIREYQEATHKSTLEVLEWAEKVGHFAPEQIEFFRDQLSKTIPVIDTVSKKLKELSVPQFSLGGTPEGVAALSDAVLRGLSDTFERGIGGSATATNNFAAQVRSLAPTLDALDAAEKHNAGTVAAYNRAINDLDPVLRTALELHKQQTKQFEDEFKTREKLRDVGPQLELETLKAEARLREDDLALRVGIIHREFDVRREELAKNGQLTEDNKNRLLIIENVATVEVTREFKKRTDAALEEIHKVAAERAKDIAHGRDERERETNELRTHLTRQRQVRLEEERKFFIEQAKLEFAARSDRPGRREQQADVFAQQAEQMRRVHLVFNDLNRDTISFQDHLKAIDAFSSNKGFLSGLQDALGGVINTFDLAQAAGFSFANALQVAFDRAINFGENFAEVFGKTMLAGILSAIGQQAIAEGTYHILAGIAKLWNPFTAAQGAAEISAGAALVAFGSALAAGASAITASIHHQQNAAAGAAATSGVSATAPPRAGVPPTVVSFPTSGGSSEIHIHMAPGDGAKFMGNMIDGHAILTLPNAKGKHNRELKRAVK